jgi:hypothetical protein
MKIQSGAGTMPIKPKLNVDRILKAEYEYIAATLFQANEGRSHVASFYFLSVGSFGLSCAMDMVQIFTD